MSRSMMRMTCAALLAALVLAAPAGAQFGGLKDKLKKKAEQAVGGDQSTPATSSTPAPASKDSTDLWYYGLDDRGLDRYITALRAQVAKIKEVEASRAARKTPEQYQQCMQEWIMSDEGQKALTEYSSAMADPAKAGPAGEKYQALLAKHCGPNPTDPNLKRQEEQDIAGAASQASHMTDAQLGLFHERIVPYLNAGGPDASTDKVFKVPGSPGMFSTYQPEEMKALKPRAAILAELLREVP